MAARARSVGISSILRAFGVTTLASGITLRNAIAPQKNAQNCAAMRSRAANATLTELQAFNASRPAGLHGETPDEALLRRGRHYHLPRGKCMTYRAGALPPRNHGISDLPPSRACWKTQECMLSDGHGGPCKPKRPMIDCLHEAGTEEGLQTKPTAHRKTKEIRCGSPELEGR